VTGRQDEPLRRRIVFNTVSNYVGKSVSLVAWFVLTPFILSHLGNELYGLWVLVGSVVAYGALLDFGVAGAVTKYVAEHRARGEHEVLRAVVTTAFVLYIGLALVFGALTLGLAFVVPAAFGVRAEDQEVAFWLVCVSGFGVALSIPGAITYGILRGLQRFDLLNAVGVAGTMLSAAATIGVLLLGGGVLGLAAVNILVMLLLQIPGVWFIRRTAPEITFTWNAVDRHVIGKVTSFSSSVFLLHLGGQLETKSDEIVIGAFMPVGAITPYNLARRLSTLPQALADQFLALLMPLASEFHAGSDERRVRRLYVASTRFTLMVFLVIGVGLSVLAAPILTVWVGPAYAEHAYLIVILTVAGLIDTSQWPAGLVLQGMGRHRFTSMMALLSGVANLALSIALVRSLGLAGVALGTLIPTTVVCLLFVMPYAMRVLGVGGREILRRVWLPALLPAAPMVVVTYFSYQLLPSGSVWSILVAWSAGAVAYVLVYLSSEACDVERQMVGSVATHSLRLAGRYSRRV
jgi:O-antigen/teichoic acid export membrane protein